MAFLKRCQDALFPASEEAIDTIPHTSIGGWSGWPYAVGSSMVLKNSVGESIRVYCILDSDYHCRSEIEQRLSDAGSRGVELHVWSKKEIENYLLVPNALLRVIREQVRRGVHPPTVDQVVRQMDLVAASLKDEVYMALSNEHLLRDRAAGVTPAMRAAKVRLDEAWSTFEGRHGIVSGKEMLSQLSHWSSREFGVSFSAKRVAQELNRAEIHPEVVDVLSAIEHSGAIVCRGQRL
jgi:hypothetical protein